MDSVRSLWGNFKCTNNRNMEVPEGEESKQEIENLFEKIITENFPNLVKEVRHAHPGSRVSQTR